MCLVKFIREPCVAIPKLFGTKTWHCLVHESAFSIPFPVQVHIEANNKMEAKITTIILLWKYVLDYPLTMHSQIDWNKYRFQINKKKV